MSNWRVGEDVPPPADFLEALMGDASDEDVGAESEYEEEFLEEYLEDDSDSSSPPPPMSRRSSPQVPLAVPVADVLPQQHHSAYRPASRAAQAGSRRSRSRSPRDRAVFSPSPAAAGGQRASWSPTNLEHEHVSSPSPPVISVVLSHEYDADGEVYPVGDPVPPEGIRVPLDDTEARALLGELNVEARRLQLVEGDDFWMPDAHALYVSDEGMNAVVIRDESIGDESQRMDESVDESLIESVGDEGGRRGSVRGRARGGRRGRARGRASGRGRGRAHQVGPRRAVESHGRWMPGHPLNEIWLHDEDVPTEFREMVRDIVRKREERAQEARERLMRRGRQERNRETVAGEESESEDDDEFLDAIADRDLLEGESQPFDWQPMTTYQSTEETFTPERTGSVGSYSTAYEAFRSYWDDGILRFIADETNRYAMTISSPSFQREWYPANSHEIICLFAFWMMLGIIRMPTIESCFSVDPLLKTEIFRRLFSRKRYINLCRALHFVDCESDNANPTGNAASSDRLYRLRPIIDHLNAKFQANYVPAQDIALDESLTLWKGRLDIKQYIRSKAARFGIKSFELCESSTGYLWSFFYYTGKQANLDLPSNPFMLKSTAVVMKLISPLLNKGYRLFMDNWYNSPLLARFLKRNGTDCVGTLRPNRSDVPELVTKAPLKQGQLIARHSGDICVLAWQDKKRITMLSTCHGSEIAQATVPSKDPPAHRPLLFKPQVVLDYNKFMGGVDLKDQMLEPYLIERKKCAKWYMKIFKRLLNCSILNSRILVESSAGRKQHHLSFRLHLVDTILDNHLALIPRTRPNRQVTIRPHLAHWPIRHAQRASDIASSRSTRFQCVLCTREGRKNSKSMFRCETCDVPLCVDPCFKAYHS